MGLSQPFSGVTQGCGIGSPEPGTGAHRGLGSRGSVSAQAGWGPQDTTSSQAQGSSQDVELGIPLKHGIPQFLWTCTNPSSRAGWKQQSTFKVL